MSESRPLKRLIYCVILLLTGCSIPEGRPSNGAQTEQVAEAAWSVGEYEEAARLFERAAERDPKSVNALIGLGKSYSELGQFSRASNALLSAAALRPRNAEIQGEMGRLALYQGDAEAALTNYQSALKIDGRNLRALTGFAVSLDYLSRHDEAQVIYKRALAAYPTNFPLMSNNALSMVIAGDRSAGIKILEELVMDYQNGEAARANLAIAYVLDGRKKDAEAILAGIFSKDEISVEIRKYMEIRKKMADGENVGHLIFN